MQIIAHRGATTYAPENTLASFQKAIDQQADCIELDVQLSLDGVPVICHDRTINRTSNGKGFIHKLTLDELKSFDFGSTYNRSFKGERIPTLEEVLQLVQHHSILLNIELKNSPNDTANLEKKVLELVYQYGLNDRVLYSAFDHMCMQRLHQIDSGAKIGLIFHINLIQLFEYIDSIRFKLQSIHPEHHYVTAELIAQAHRRNIKVNTYTVNNIKLAKTFQKMGVDGLITNDPLILK